jgi:hypothetical protein
MSDVASPDVSSWDDLIKKASGHITETEHMAGSGSRKRQREISDQLRNDRPPPAPGFMYDDSGRQVPDSSQGDSKPPKPMPPEQQRSPMEMFGSAASVLGILGGLLSRAPLTASLKAATGAMNGYRQRDLETYQQNLAQWKAQSEYAERLSEWQQNRYKAAYDQYKDNHDALMGEWRMLATQDGNDIARKAAETGDMRVVEEALRGKDASLDNFRRWRTEVNKIMTGRSVELQAAEEMKQTPEWMMATGDKKVKMLSDLHKQFEKQGTPQSIALQRFLELNPDASPDQISHFLANMRNSSIEVSPEDLQSMAGQAASGEPLTQIVPGYRQDATALRQKVRAAAIEKIRKDDPGLSAEDAGLELANRTIEFQAGKRSETQLITMLGATHQAVDQLSFNIGKVKEEMGKLGSTDLSPVLNAIARGEEKWTGEPAYSSLFFYMQAAAVESARILSSGQASIAQLHQGAMEKAQEWANINMTPASWDAVSKAMEEEGAYRLKTFQDAIKFQRRGAKPDAPSAPPPSSGKTIKYDSGGNRLP